MSAGAKIGAATRALLILGVIWAVLLGIGWAMGVFPAGGTADPAPDDPESTGELAAQTPELVPDASVIADAGAETTPEDPALAPGEEEPTQELTPDAADPATDPPEPGGWHVQLEAIAGGPPVGARARLRVATLGGVPVLVVAHGANASIVAELHGRPTRVLRAHTEDGGAATPARPLVADLTGDGTPDVALGFARLDASGGPTGGTGTLLVGHPAGGFEGTRDLGDLAAVGGATIRNGDDVGFAFVHWADGFGRRPSELWTYAAGASPSRRARVRLGNDGSDVVAADLDADGESEWVVVDGATVRRVVNGRVASSIELSEGRGRRATAADLDRDGSSEVLVFGDTLDLLSRDDLTSATRIEAPPGIQAVLAADVSDGGGDGLTDLLVVTRDAIVVLEQRGRWTFERRPLVDLPGTLRVEDAVRFERTGQSRFVLVARSNRGWELLTVPFGVRARVQEPAEPPPAIEASPLMPDFPL